MLTNNDNCGTPQQNLQYESESCFYAQGRDLKNLTNIGVGGVGVFNGKFNDIAGLRNINNGDASISVSLNSPNRLVELAVNISATPGNTLSLNPDGLFAGAGSMEAFPVGSIFISVDNTNPAITLGYGTWVPFAQGRVLIGQDPADVDFDVAEETGGSKTIQIKCDELPACESDDPYDDLFLLMGA